MSFRFRISSRSVFGRRLALLDAPARQLLFRKVIEQGLDADYRLNTATVLESLLEQLGAIRRLLEQGHTAVIPAGGPQLVGAIQLPGIQCPEPRATDAELQTLIGTLESLS